MTTRFSLLTGIAAFAAALGLTLAASGPASAQTNPPASQPPAASQSPPPATEAPAHSEQMGNMHKMTHHPAKGHMANRTSRTTDSGNAMVDKLNEQSLQAAQAGQTFNPGAGGATTPAAPPPAPAPNKGM